MTSKIGLKHIHAIAPYVGVNDLLSLSLEHASDYGIKIFYVNSDEPEGGSNSRDIPHYRIPAYLERYVKQRYRH